MTPPLIIDPALFDPASVSPDVDKFHQDLQSTFRPDEPKWWQVGAAEFRRRRKAGETSRPVPVVLESGSAFPVPSRDKDRPIPCRVLKPQNAKPPRGLYMHIHGGGWVLGDEESTDTQLQEFADDHGLICLSVGYRLAPEHPFPAGPEDCYDVGEWLVSNAQDSFGAPLAFIGGESAGGHLTALTVLHLLRHPDPNISGVSLRGVIFNYGCFTLNYAPAARHMASHHSFLILTTDDMDHFRDVVVPGWTVDVLERPDVSPLYADLEALRGRLPPAIFTCGTRDCLLDDTLLMSTRWAAAGGEAALKIVPGAQHGYTLFPKVPGSGAEEGLAAVNDFFSKKL